METFSALLAICAGNSPVSGEFPTQRPGQWRGALMFTLICVWINGCVNNGEAGDLKRYCAHYGVTVMCRLWHRSAYIWDPNTKVMGHKSTSLGYLPIYPPQIATVMKPISFCSMHIPVSHTKSLGESREWNMVFQCNIWYRLKAF